MSTQSAHYDAVVIGSGFGGSISALRLAEARKSVLVLERGKRYQPGEFPRDVTDVKRLFWRYPKHRDSLGLYDIRFFSSVAAVVASGVGGGSLVYANIHIRPDAVIFDDPRWPSTINRATLDPYYDKVASMLEIAPIPPQIELVKRDVYRDAARQIGREVFDPDMAVKWTGKAEGRREPCKLVAECEFGCQFGAKNTLDLTYLARAEYLGTRIQPNCNVTRIEQVPEGYRVTYLDLTNGAEQSVTGRRVVLCAGTLGTNEILLRCRDVFRTLPNLSRRLGAGYSGNGDFLGSIQNSKVDLQPWVGPDVTSVIRYFESAPEFTMAAPTFNQSVMRVIASMGQDDGKWLRPFSALLWPLLPWLTPWAFKKGFLSQPSKRRGKNAGDPARMTNLFAIGRDNANGSIRLKRSGIDITWDYKRENQQLIEKMESAMQEVTNIYGGTYSPLITWNIFKKITTVHSLGGCHLSNSPDTGVVSPEGEVHGYPGLFIADGSVIPTSIGFHPVMTISAVAERIAEAIVNSF
jgi:cholesterol oxidase